MNKTLVLTIALVATLIGSAATVAPAQAASRLMISSNDGFQYRCEKYSGAYASDGTSVICNTPSVMVTCEYFTARQANCNWSGRDSQIDVVRVIGTLPEGWNFASSSSSGNGGNTGNGGVGGSGGKGGGFDGPKNFGDAPKGNPNPGFNGPGNFGIAP